MVDRAIDSISIARQAELLSLNRSGLYYKSVDNNEKKQTDKILMDFIDEIYTATPFYGRRKMTRELRTKVQFSVNEKRVGRLMKVMGLEAIYPKPNLSRPNKEHKKYKYIVNDPHKSLRIRAAKKDGKYTLDIAQIKRIFFSIVNENSAAWPVSQVTSVSVSTLKDWSALAKIAGKPFEDALLAPLSRQQLSRLSSLSHTVAGK